MLRILGLWRKILDRIINSSKKSFPPTKTLYNPLHITFPTNNPANLEFGIGAQKKEA